MKYVAAKLGDVIIRNNSVWLVVSEFKNNDGDSIIVVLLEDGTTSRFTKIYAPKSEVI